MTDVNSCVSALIKEKKRRNIERYFQVRRICVFLLRLSGSHFFPFLFFFISVTQSPKISHVEIPKEINFPSFS